MIGEKWFFQLIGSPEAQDPATRKADGLPIGGKGWSALDEVPWRDVAYTRERIPAFQPNTGA
jgi:hypothetical protein